MIDNLDQDALQSYIKSLDAEYLARFEIFYEKMRTPENPIWSEIFCVKLQRLPKQAQI